MRLARLSRPWVPALLLALAALLPACSDAPPTAPPADPPATEPASPTEPPLAGEEVDPEGTPKGRALTKEESDRRVQENHAHAWKLIQSFRGEAYDPARDSKLTRVVGQLHVRIDDADSEVVTGRYMLDFDASRRPRMQTRLEPGPGADTLPEFALSTAQAFASTGMRGGYYTVVTHLPPTHLTLLKPKSQGKWLVHAPPDDFGPGVSYIFDDGNLVVTRGTSAPDSRRIDYFEWERIENRSFLRARRQHGGGAETTWEYQSGEHDVVLPKTIVHREGKRTAEFRFEYERIETAPD